MTEENGAAKAEEPTPLEAKIIRQVEYYFGDNNLPRDKFIQEKIKEDDGWITMEVMLNFKRLANLSSDKDVILAALRKSTSGLMEIGEDKIRRNPDKPIPENYDAIKDQCKDRVVYVKGFPEDATLDEVMEFMNKFGQTEYINMRRMPKDKKFKGSIFCTFEKEEDAKKFLAEESVKYGETEVIKSSKDAYFERKNEERKKNKEAQVLAKKEKDEADQSQILKDRYTKGAILHLKNLPTDTKRAELKEQMNKIEPVHWVDYEDGETEAKIRFTTENGAVRGWEKAQASGEDGKFKLGDNEIEGRVLEGTEEEEHWQELIKQWRGAKDRNRENRGGRRGGRGGGRGRSGGRGGGRGGFKRSAPSSDDGPSEAKQAKTE